MGKITKIPYNNTSRESWVKEREIIQGIGNSDVVRFGSSDISTILYGKFDSPVRLYYNMIGRYPKNFSSVKLELGIAAEPCNITMYESYSPNEDDFIENLRTGNKIATLRKPDYFLINSDYPYLFSSLDAIRMPGSVDWSTGEVTESQLICELKSVGINNYMTWGGEPPLYYKTQVHQQMIVSGTYEADLCCLVAGEMYKVFRIFYDQALADRVVEATNDFAKRVLAAKAWVKYGEETGDTETAEAEIAKLEPPIGYSDSDSELLGEMFDYEDSVDGLVEGNDLTDVFCERYLKANRVISLADKYKSFMKNRLIRFSENDRGGKTKNYQWTRFSKTGKNLFKLKKIKDE